LGFSIDQIENRIFFVSDLSNVYNTEINIEEAAKEESVN